MSITSILIDVSALDFFINPLFVTFCVFFFTLGSMITGVRNLIRILLSIEVMLLCLTFVFVVLAVAVHNITGQVFALFILAIAACESALGLSLLIMFFRNRGMLSSFESLSSLKG